MFVSQTMPIRSSDVAPTPSPPSTEGRPSPSLINARGLSLVPTSTPSPSLTIANMPTDEDVPNLTMEDPPPPNDRPIDTLINGAFHSSKVAAKAITLSIRQQFANPKLVWRPKEKNEIKKAFNSKVSHRLSEMLRDSRNENKRSYWIGDHVWNDLLSH
ncbi:hypothetical protein GmHk_17G049374 [Glycine max]|nr:hypothetical protein GmHk_17G049374 [Glycine max]